MINTRMLATAYVVLLLSLATFWIGLHSLPYWLIVSVFFVGFVAAVFTVIYPWASYKRSKKQRLECTSLETRNEL